MATEHSKQIFVVLGMHRSGTSAITRGLDCLGVDLGGNLIGPAEDNPKGFWEDNDITPFNDRLLAHFGLAWDSLCGLPENFLDDPEIHLYLHEARGLLQEKLRESTRYGFKDPRVSRLLPFWKKVFDLLELEASYLIVSRNPLSVAASLRARNGFASEKSYLLWLLHNLPSVLDSRGSRRLVVDYDLVMNDPAGELKRVARHFDLPLEKDNLAALEEFAGTFLSDDLRHSAFRLEELQKESRIGEAGKKVYAQLLELARDRKSLDDKPVMQALRRHYRELTDMRPFLAYADSLEGSIGAQDAEVRSLNGQIFHLNEEKNQIFKGLSLAEELVAERNRECEDLKALAAEKEKMAADYQAQLTQSESARQTLEKMGADYQAQLAESEATREGLEKTVADYQAQLAESEQSRQALADEHNAKIAMREADFAHERTQLFNQLRATEAQVGDLTGRIEALWASTSWKMTRPFRFVSNLLRLSLRDREQLRPYLSGHARRIYWGLPLGNRLKYRIRNAVAGHWPALLKFLQADTPGFPAPNAGGEQPADTRIAERLLPSRRYRVICFPIIEWSFRYQRPQQLASEYAAGGHEVLYVSHEFTEETRAREIKENIFEITLPGPAGLNPYQDPLDAALVDRMADALLQNVEQTDACPSVVLVQLPFWQPLADAVAARLGCPLIYDCMDDHEGFSTNSPAMVEIEQQLLTRADLVVASSRVLLDKIGEANANTLLLQNACNYDHFSQYAPVPATFREQLRIGYFGAIADWFDVKLIAELARTRPQWQFDLVGSTFSADTAPLKGLPNVKLSGEKPYDELPAIMRDWDCCVIPFLRTPLTEATNPVKVYEMLAAGKPVVAIPLPELEPLADQGLIGLAERPHEFAAAIEEAVRSDSRDRIEARQAFARQNTWNARYQTLDARTRQLWPLASVVIVTYNNLEMNRLCLRSVLHDTSYPHLEVIVVDNASSDGTPEYLKELAAEEPRLQVICNEDNRGFAIANNQGLKIARGEYLCLLNNDTVVPAGWLSTLIGHLEDNSELGLIGPVTNSIANEAQIEVGYAELQEMPSWAAGYCRRHRNELFDIPMLAFFCVALPRRVFAEVGYLDERFGKGMFEDDDYCRRVREAGFELKCARDSFVHHWQRASFKLLGEEEYMRIYEENQRQYEQKWVPKTCVRPGTPWKGDISFEALSEKIRASRGCVIFAPSVGWDIHLFQRPHHLARALAQMGYITIFDASNACDPVEGMLELEPDLFLYRGEPAALAGLPDLTLWCFSYNFDYCDHFPKGTQVFYDWIDDLEVFPYDQKQLRKLHDRAMKEADALGCVARTLLDEARETRPDALYLPNGVDYARFASPQGDDVPASDWKVSSFLSDGSPIAGYYGALAEWFDYKMLAETARLRPDWRFLLIGPDHDGSIGRSKITRVDNILWVGPRDYKDLPVYLARFDVAMIPFKINAITKATSPLKLYEYFAGGKAVVTSPMPECMQFEEVLIADGAAQFSEKLDQAAEAGKDPAFQERVRALGRENSWESRVETVMEQMRKAAQA